MENEKFDIDAFRAQPLPTEEEVMANWQGDIDKPVVSVLCHTFNQELYIEDAFRGFLLQKTDFPFEVIVNDDCSTDQTLKIIEKYQTLYPNLIKVIKHERNMFSLGVRPINFTLPQARGEYICLCEGDDFWSHNLKLKIHIDFLSENNQFTFHVLDCIEIDEKNEIISHSKINRLNVDSGKIELKTKKNVSITLLPLTSCFVNDFKLPFPRYFNKSINGDLLLNYILLLSGDGYVDDACKVAVYRLSDQGIWANKSNYYKNIEHFHTKLVLSQYTKDKDESVSRELLFGLVIDIVRGLPLFTLLSQILKKLFRKIC